MNNEENEKEIPAYLHPFADLMRDYLTFEYDFENLKREGVKDFNRASAVGRDFYTNYHYRLGTPYTNTPTAEGIGKMKSGSVFHEYVQDLLAKMGILNKAEYKIELPELNVKGHPDAHVGGVIDYAEEIKRAEVGASQQFETAITDDLPTYMWRLKLAWLKAMQKKYPKGIEKTLIEFKSLSAFRFAGKEATGWEADEEHVLQATEYVMGSPDLDKAIIIYICRDDFRMAVCDVDIEANIPKVEKYWKTLNRHVDREQEPDVEPEVVQDADGRSRINWHVLYSPYLTKMYPQYETKQDLMDFNEPIARELNKAWAKEKLTKELKAKYSKKDMEGRLLELYGQKKWVTTEYSVLKELTGKIISKGKLIADKK